MKKNFILNADDFGMSDAFNSAVLEGNTKGILTSASICANGEAFDSAIKEILPQCPTLSLGVHLNIIEGKSLTKCPLLTDKNGEFNNGYISMILKSFDIEFLEQVEKEFRAQIEKVLNVAKVDHIDSHVHTHAIPNIFKITAKLAKEYNIPYIRTQFEKPYITPVLKKHLNSKYPPNILKIILLNMFTILNKPVAKRYDLKFNDYLIGVGYTGMMDNKTIEYGLNALKKDCLAECLIHPCKFDKPSEDSHYFEYLATINEDLKEKITEFGFDMVNHSGVI